MEINILPMSEEHLPEVFAIEQASFHFPWSRNSFRREFTNSHAYYLVACLQEGGGVLGYVGAWMLFTEAHITTLAVNPPCRRQGVATLLLNKLLEKACSKGVHSVFLEVRCSNLGAKSLYEKFNFKMRGRRKNYYQGEDALVMVCDLKKLSSERGLGDVT